MPNPEGLEDELYYQRSMFHAGFDHPMDVPVSQQAYLVPTYQEQPMPYLVPINPGYVLPELEPAFIRSAPVPVPEPEPVVMPEPMEEPEIPYDSGYNEIFINMALQQAFPDFEPPEPEEPAW